MESLKSCPVMFGCGCYLFRLVGFRGGGRRRTEDEWMDKSGQRNVTRDIGAGGGRTYVFLFFLNWKSQFGGRRSGFFPTNSFVCMSADGLNRVGPRWSDWRNRDIKETIRSN